MSETPTLQMRALDELRYATSILRRGLMGQFSGPSGYRAEAMAHTKNALVALQQDFDDQDRIEHREGHAMTSTEQTERNARTNLRSIESKHWNDDGTCHWDGWDWPCHTASVLEQLAERDATIERQAAEIIDLKVKQHERLTEADATIAELRGILTAEISSWRRVAERLEGEKRAALLRLEVAEYCRFHRPNARLDAGAAQTATVVQIIACHSCGSAVHAEHHTGSCSMCGADQREYCCECWDAEDTSCRREYEHDYEPDDAGAAHGQQPVCTCGHAADLHALDGRGVTPDSTCEAEDGCSCEHYQPFHDDEQQAEAGR